MPNKKNRVFGLDHSLHTRFLQMKTNCTGRERFIDDVGYSFGHLDSIFSSTRGDKMLGIADVGRRKLGKMTSNSLGKSRILFRAKFGYSRRADTSLLGNGFTKMASVKQRENSALLSEKEGFNYDSG